MKVIHKHYEMGTAPYRFVGFWEAPSQAVLSANPHAYNQAMANSPACCKCSCDHCGTGIKLHMIIEDSEGSQFAVGSSCIAKLNQQSLVTDAKAAKLARDKRIRREKAQANRDAQNAAYEARLERERTENGGLTNWEVEQSQIKAEKNAKKIKNRDIAGYFYDALIAQNGDFCASIVRDIENGHKPEGRASVIVCEIAAKYHSDSRKGSKKYKAEIKTSIQKYEEMLLT